ncbi:hypothetical protein [Aquimarina addita]
MVLEGHLFGNKKDIGLLEIIEEEAKNNQLVPITKYGLKSLFKQSFPIITLLFGIYTTLILSNSKDFILDSKLVLVYSLLLFLFIFLLLYSDYLILDILNAKYRKQKIFLKRITHLKTTLKLKYKISK